MRRNNGKETVLMPTKNSKFSSTSVTVVRGSKGKDRCFLDEELVMELANLKPKTCYDVSKILPPGIMYSKSYSTRIVANPSSITLDELL